jgi:ubiquinone/menaquinone biosynthesis C-methylase UbiE
MAERGPKFERKEKLREKLIVELGSGSLPVVAEKTAEYRDLFDADKNARYIGIDLNHDVLSHGRALQMRNDAESGRPENDRISYVNARAESLSLKDASVDELILRNVLGDPDIPVEEKRATLNEVARVLKKDALLKVIEVYTPLMVYEDDLFAYIDAMDGHLLRDVSAEETGLGETERRADAQLSHDEAAGVTWLGNQSFVRYYRRA